MKSMPLILSVALLLHCSSKPVNLHMNHTQSATELDIQLNDWGTPARIAGDVFTLPGSNKPEKNILDYVSQNKSVYKLENPTKELAVQKDIVDDLGFRHLHFSRLHKGLPIFANELVFHINQDNIVYLVQGDYLPSLPKDFKTKAKISKNTAIDRVKAAAGFSATFGAQELYIYPIESTYKLVWRIVAGVSATSLEQWECFIDAQTGELVHKASLIRP